MSDPVLVSYATRYGSTQEVAERVGETLRAGGLPVDVQPARQVRSLEGCRAVVLCAPLYIGRWQKDARRFLERHQEALTGLPLAVLTLGPTREGEWDEVRAQMDKELAKVPALKPVATALFGGKYDPAKLRFPDNLLTIPPASPLHQMPANDLRDWEAIDEWANGLVGKL
jgi:menaquinone-dependent protoporphyrinogen oxidase